jgi:hypothetical protein
MGNGNKRKAAMRNNISSGVYILTQQDLNEREHAAYVRGVERGRLEESMARGIEKVAVNCAHWKNGICDHCGAQHQGCEVSYDFYCPHFVRR